MLLTDTVGFINKLPTFLIAAFRATLEEINEATVLIHVLDIRTQRHASILARSKGARGARRRRQADDRRA